MGGAHAYALALPLNVIVLSIWSGFETAVTNFIINQAFIRIKQQLTYVQHSSRNDNAGASESLTSYW